MEKITILCGTENRQKAEKFMEDVTVSLLNRGYFIEDVNKKDLVLITKYTQIGFIYDEYAQPLCGVKADAIFGREPSKQKMAPYLKVHAPYKTDKSLVDYICECEKNGPELEVKANVKAAFEKYDKQIEDIRQVTRKDFDYASLYPKQVYITSAQTTGKSAYLKEWERCLHKDEFVSYSKADCDITYDLYKKHMNNANSTLPEIKDVIFNNPATIVFWADGTKTVVQSRGEGYDPEKGLAMAIVKKAMGNKREYYYIFLHWLKKV